MSQRGILVWSLEVDIAVWWCGDSVLSSPRMIKLSCHICAIWPRTSGLFFFFVVFFLCLSPSLSLSIPASQRSVCVSLCVCACACLVCKKRLASFAADIPPDSINICKVRWLLAAAGMGLAWACGQGGARTVSRKPLISIPQPLLQGMLLFASCTIYSIGTAA